MGTLFRSIWMCAIKEFEFHVIVALDQCKQPSWEAFSQFRAQSNCLVCLTTADSLDPNSHQEEIGSRSLIGPDFYLQYSNLFLPASPWDQVRTITWSRALHQILHDSKVFLPNPEKATLCPLPTSWMRGGTQKLTHYAQHIDFNTTWMTFYSAYVLQWYIYSYTTPSAHITGRQPRSLALDSLSGGSFKWALI